MNRIVMKLHSIESLVAYVFTTLHLKEAHDQTNFHFFKVWPLHEFHGHDPWEVALKTRLP